MFDMIKLGIFPNHARPRKDVPSVEIPQKNGVKNVGVVSTISASMSITVLQCDQFLSGHFS